MSGVRVLPWAEGEREGETRETAPEPGQPEAGRLETEGGVGDGPVGEPSGPGSTVQAGGAMPGRETGSGDQTTGEAMLAPTMPGEDAGVA